MDTKRIKRAIKKSFAAAREAIKNARECPSAFNKRVAIETVIYHRKLNADRRRAMSLGRTA